MLGFRRNVLFCKHKVGEPQRQAIDENNAIRPAFTVKDGCQIELLFNGAPCSASLRLVRGNPLGHFRIKGGTGCDIGFLKACTFSKSFREPAFSGAGSAKNKGGPGTIFRSGASLKDVLGSPKA